MEAKTNKREILAQDSSSSSAPSKKKKMSLPTPDEQFQLQQASTLVRTNILKLQVEEVLQEVKHEKLYSKKSINDWIESFSNRLKSLKPSKSVNKVDQHWLTKHQQNGFSLDGASAGASCIAFLPPAAVERIGSFALQTATFPFVNIDLCISMPVELFSHMDIADHSYFNKRKLYLAALAMELSSGGFDDLFDRSSVKLAAFKGELDKPIVVLTPTFTIRNTSAVVRLIPAIPASVFRLANFNPARKNNNRDKNLPNVAQVETDDAEGCLYNMSVAEDCAILPQFKLLKKIYDAFPVARDVVLLLKVWLAQRQLRWAVDAVDGYLVNLLVAYMYQTRRVSLASTSLAVFQYLMNFFAQTDLLGNRLSFLSSDLMVAQGDIDDCEERFHLRSCFPWALSLVHPLVGSTPQDVFEYNSLWRVSRSSWRQLREEAAHTLNLLQSGGEGVFSEIFIQSRTFFKRYDLFFHVVVSSANGGPENSRRLMPIAAQVEQVAERAMGKNDRVLAMHTFICATESHVQLAHFHEWALNAKPRFHQAQTIAIGVILDRENSIRRVDKGPAAKPLDEASAESTFKQFWGPKCSLRRFQDGSIVEAVVWEVSQTNGAAKSTNVVPKGEDIVEQILRFALGRHLPTVAGPDGELIRCGESRWDKFLPASGSDQVIRGDRRLRFDAETLTTHAVRALDKLRGLLTSQLNLPLIIDTVQTTCPALRYTSLCPQIPHPFILGTKEALKDVSGQAISIEVQPIAVVASLEPSGKWPTEKAAMENLLTAFQLALSDVLRKDFQLKTFAHQSWLDIPFEGYLFRLRLKPKGAPSGDSSDPLAADSFAELQSHHQAIRGLHSQHPSFSASVRLAMLWLHGHMLSDQVTQETMELLMSSVYLNPDRLHPPSCPTAGLVQFLRRLTTWDWQEDPLLLDFTLQLNKLKAAEFANSYRKFHRNGTRSSLVLLACYNTENVQFPSFVSNPSSPMLQLILQCAASTLSSLLTSFDAPVLANSGLLVSPAVDSVLFDPKFVLSSCNVLLGFRKAVQCPVDTAAGGELMSAVAAGPSAASVTIFANLPSRDTDFRSLHVSEYPAPHPKQAEVVDRLRQRFSHYAIFVWNAVRGDTVGVIWKPKVFASNNFSILGVKHRLLVLPSTGSSSSASGCLAVVNTSELLAEMIECGQGLIGSVNFC